MINPSVLLEKAKKRYGVENINRFFNKFSKSEGCWIWTDRLDRGYGRLSYAKGKKYIFSHRLALELKLGKLRPHQIVDHICRNRACVNPKHLRIVSIRENVLENSLGITAINKTKTKCKRGHQFNKENTRHDFNRAKLREELCRD